MSDTKGLDEADEASAASGPELAEPPKSLAPAAIEDLLRLYDLERPHLEVFLGHIQKIIAATAPGEFRAAVHSIRSRLKDTESISGKLVRKKQRGIAVTCDNSFDEFADLAGIRFLTLYRWGFEPAEPVNESETAVVRI